MPPGWEIIAEEQPITNNQPSFPREGNLAAANQITTCFVLSIKAFPRLLLAEAPNYFHSGAA